MNPLPALKTTGIPHFLPRLILTAVIAGFGLLLMGRHDEIWTSHITPVINYRVPTFEDFFFRLPLAAFFICASTRGKTLLRLLPTAPPSWIVSIFSWCVFGSGIWYFNTLCLKLKNSGITAELFLVSGSTCLLISAVSAVAANVSMTPALAHTWFNAFKRPFGIAFAVTILLKTLFLNAFNPFLQDNLITDAAYPLKWIVFSSIHGLLSPFFYHPLIDLEKLRIGTEQFFVYLHFGCSGYQGLTLFLICAVCFYAIFRNDLTLSVPGFAGTLLVGAGITLIGNIFRITALLAIGSTGFQEWALGGFHSSIGTIFFFVIMTGYVYLVYRFFGRSPKPVMPVIKDIFNRNPAAPYIAPFLGLACATIFLRTFTVQWDWLYPVRMLICFWLLWQYRQKLSFGGSASFDSYLTAFSAGVVIALIWLTIPAGHHFHPEGAFLSVYPSFLQYAWIFFRFAGSVLVIPIVEELLFRGYLPRVLIHLDFEKIPIGMFSPFSFAASAAAFGVLHHHLWGGMISGIIFNLVLMRTRSLKAAIVCHSAANLIIFLNALSTGVWSS